MTIVIYSWIIPLVLTIIILVVMFRPSNVHGSSDIGEAMGSLFEGLLRILWLIPISLIWLVYCLFLLWSK